MISALPHPVYLPPEELCLLFLFPVTVTQWSTGLPSRDGSESVPCWLQYWGSTDIKSDQEYACPSASPNQPRGEELWIMEPDYNYTSKPHFLN